MSARSVLAGTSRRTFLRATAGMLLAPTCTIARSVSGNPVQLEAPPPMVQIHVTAAGELLAVSAAGVLWQYADGRWAQRAVQLDPGAPIASGHGRVAGRSARGTLWVLESGRVSVASEPTLAAQGGFHILSFGIIAVMQGRDRRASVVRMEPASDGAWKETARSTDPVLPDARPLQTDLDGSGNAEDGHIVVLAGPDSERYRHGALGDEIEPTRLLYLERHGLQPIRSLTLPAPYVFEDLAPRPIAWRGGNGLLTVRSGPRGGQLAVIAASRDRRNALQIDAVGEPIGIANRWMAPTTDGTRLLAVHTPHIGGVLFEYRVESGRLTSRTVASGASNHVLGQRELDLATWVDSMLLLPAQDRRRLRIFDAEADWLERPPLALPFPVVATRALQLDGRPGCALLLDDGTIWWATTRP